MSDVSHRIDRWPSRAVIDLTAIRDNVRALQGRAPDSQVMAVVKADAYGHGILPSARAALAGGATWLGVAQLPEALALRGAGITGQQARLLTWLYAPGAPLREAIEADIDISVSALWGVEEVVAAARAAQRTARVHIKADTGLGRGGVQPADLPDVLRAAACAQSEGVIDVVGFWSHLAFADEPGHPVTSAQIAVFDEGLRAARKAGITPEVRHLASSAATLTDPRTHYDLVRPGLAVYGLSPIPHIARPAELGLREAMTLQARFAVVKRAPAGQGISYGHTYTTQRETVLGVVPLGYGDGIPRHASGDGSAQAPGGPVWVGEYAQGGSGRVLRVAGRVCMDQFVLDLGPDACERAGDTVTLFGVGSDLESAGLPTAQDWAQAAGTISYEITTRLGSRVPRVYIGAEAVGVSPSAVGGSVVDAAAVNPGPAASVEGAFAWT